MFTETAVLARVAPICSAIDMKRLLKTSSRSGETWAGSAEGRAGGEVLRSSSSPPARIPARQPGSTTVVLVGSQTIAGPSTVTPGARSSRTYTGASCVRPPVKIARRLARPWRSATSAPAGIAVPDGIAVPAAGAWLGLAEAGVRSRAGADRLHGDGLEREAAPGHQEPVPHAVQVEEGGRHVVRSGPRHRQRDVRALVLDVAAALDARLRGRDALQFELGYGRRLELRQGGGRGRAARLLQRRLDAPLAQRAHVGEAHAVGAEHAGERVQERLRHPERVRDEAGVLPGGAAEAAEHVVADVVPALRGDPLDRARHRLAGHAHEVVGELFRRRRFDAGGAHARGHGRERLARRRLVDGPGAVRAEHVREEGRPQLARHQVAVGDGERPALAVARRPGVGAGAARADPVAPALEGADRPAARRHRVYAQHRRAQAHAADHALVAALQLAGVVAHVGGRAAHVEGDDLVEPRQAAHGDGADDAAGGPREDRVLAAEEAGVGEAAVRLHEAQPHVGRARAAKPST